MTDQLYSAEEAAEILGLQVRTVRNYVREGRLAGVRIGKQYRIAHTDLEAFTGGLARVEAEQPPAVTRRTVEVSSIVQVDGLDASAADRVTRTLAAAVAGSDHNPDAPRVEPIYDERSTRLRVIIVGGAEATAELIRIVEASTRAAAGPLGA